MWLYVHGCEHCGVFEIPRWGLDEDGVTWCAGCAVSQGIENPGAPDKVEFQLVRVDVELHKLKKLATAYNEKAQDR